MIWRCKHRSGEAMRSVAGTPSRRGWKVVERATAILLGLFLGILLAELLLRAGGALLLHRQQQRNLEALRRQRDVTILCLGESTTAGMPGTGSYPALLQEILNDAGLGLDFAVVNEGRSGASSSHLVERLDDVLDRVRPDLVVTMIGINDAGRTLAWRTLLEPGAGRWYGEWRLYKLWQLALSAKPPAEATPPSPIRPVSRIALGLAITPRAATPTPVPESVHKQLEAARTLLHDGDLAAAQAAIAELGRNLPELDEVAILEAQLLRARGEEEEAHRWLRAAYQRLPSASVSLSAALADSHARRGEYRAAIRLVRYVLAVLVGPEAPHDTRHYATWLARLHEQSGDPARAEEILRTVADQLGAGDERTRQPLIEFYRRQGRAAEAGAELAEQRRLRDDFVNPITQRNYASIREMLRDAGVDLVAVQYPMRDIDSLRALLGPSSDVITVDNSMFAQLVARDGYDRYFSDRFAGDFGHLTARGNCILATRIATAILRHHLGSEHVDGGRLARAAEAGTCALQRRSGRQMRGGEAAAATRP